MQGPPEHTSLTSFVALEHILDLISALHGSRDRVPEPKRAGLRTFGDIFSGKKGTETGGQTWRMQGPPEHTSLTSFVALEHILDLISALHGSRDRVTDPKRAGLQTFGDTFTVKDKTGGRTYLFFHRKRHRDGRSIVAHALPTGEHKSAKFRRSKTYSRSHKFVTWLP
ncbi:hypothetical protein DPMN_130375 [Dreissena polymorpha]|uniref:Uncharacterized protein n=1 Tax=Dreissena polymorpha TaxID=45954 RepID=A0A9D4H7I4_DREPO|nr:hypothetical protein DPMN_130375 [Dreissena polymorpha]